MSFTFVTITHTWQLPDGAGALGTVEAGPAHPDGMHLDGRSITGVVRGVLSAQGAMAITVAATTAPGTSPPGVPHRLVVRLPGRPPLVFYVPVPHDRGATLELADLLDWATHRFGPTAVPLAAVGGILTPDADLGYGPHRYTATSNITLGDPTGGYDGQTIEVQILASGGDRRLYFPGGDDFLIPDGFRWRGHYQKLVTGDDVDWLLDDTAGGLNTESNGLAQLYDVDTAGAQPGRLLAATAINPLSVGFVPPPAAYTDEQVRDVIAAALVAGANVTITPNDAGDTITIAAAGGGTGGVATVQDEGTALTQRPTINFVGRNVTASDNSGSTRTDVVVSDNPRVHAVGNSGTALTLDASASAGDIKTITLTGNCTFSFTGAAAGRAATLELVLTQDATGGRTVTWPSGTRWAGGAPTLSTAGGATDRVVLTSYDGGTTWYGDLVGKAYA